MKRQQDFFDAAGRASVLGLHLVSGLIVGGLLGYGLDAWAGCHPWGFIGGLVLGIIAGFRNLWQDASAMLRRMDDTNKKQDRP